MRAWTDADAAFAAAKAAGVPEEMLYERRPVTLAALEKIMGKKAFAAALGGCVATPPGKPALVRADDDHEGNNGGRRLWNRERGGTVIWRTTIPPMS